MVLDKVLGKSSNESLISHTDKVLHNVTQLCVKYNIDVEDTNILKYSAILHDIGKINFKIQKHFKSGKDESERMKFSHNIIGWNFIIQYVNLPNKSEIANLVLWHHANTNSCEQLSTKISDIDNEISNDELNLMFEFCKHYDIPVCNGCEVIGDTQFYGVKNLLRCILITSDVCASNSSNILNLYPSPIIELEMLNSDFINSSRTKEQISIINDIREYKTTVIKAPTGFGKSIIGVLFSLRQAKTTIWVCPTNIIASSIYHDVIETLKMMGINITVELYLTGEVRSANHDSYGFNSKLIITNIDNFVKPSVSNSYGDRCLQIYDCPVIFDEPHEYDKMDCALNMSFINIMIERHNRLKSTTILLTATPRPIRFNVVGGDEVIYLPNKESHYNAKHDKKYNIVFHDTTPTNLLNGEFVFFSHTVNDVQENYNQYDGDKVIAHGRYLEEHKERQKNLVLNNYGKGCPRLKLGVFTNQILTTACDYTVNTMFIKCPTIWEFFQALGRLNRFGDMDEATIHVILEKTKADEIHIGANDDNDLQELFMNELKIVLSNGYFILNELYNFYNDFNKRHFKLIDNISKQNKRNSEAMLKYVFPKKYKEKSTNGVNGNKMRQSSISEGIYISVRREDSNEFETIDFNLNKKIGYEKTFGEDSNTFKNQIKILKQNDDYNKHVKLTSESMKKSAIFYDTPYIVFNYKYSDELGLVKIN